MTKQKRKKPVTTGHRTMEWFRKQNCIAQKVERWIPQARKRLDLFGLADIVVVGWPGYPTLYVQTTTDDHHAEHRTLIERLDVTKTLLANGNGVALVSWKKRPMVEGVRGGRKVWKPRIEIFSLGPISDIRSIELQPEETK